MVQWNRLVYGAVYAELQQGHLPILLGGDHSLGLGSISAVARHCAESGKSCACCGSMPMPTSTPAR